MPAPYGTYPTSDGYLALAMNPIDKIGALLEDPYLTGLTDPQAWWDAQAEIEELLAARFATRTTEEWLTLRDRVDVWCAPVLTLEQLVEHDGFAAIAMTQPVGRDAAVTPTTGRTCGCRPPAARSGSTAAADRRAGRPQARPAQRHRLAGFSRGGRSVTTLRGITWEHPRGYDCVVGAAQAYAEVVAGVEVRWDYRSLQAFGDAPIAQLSAAYDLMVIDHPHVPLAAEAGLLAPLDGVGFDDELARLAEQSVGGSHVSYAYRGRQRRGPANAESGMFLAADDALSALDLLHRLTAYVPERNLANNPIQVSEQLSTSDEWCYAPLLFGYTNYARAGFRTGRLKYTDMPSRASTGSANVSGLAGSLLAGAGIAVGHCGRPRRRPGLRPLARLGRRAARGLLRQRRPTGQRRGLGRRAAERRHPGLLHRDPGNLRRRVRPAPAARVREVPGHRVTAGHRGPAPRAHRHRARTPARRPGRTAAGAPVTTTKNGDRPRADR